MKQKLLLSILLSGFIFTSFSCKKEGDSTPDSYLKFKKDGVWITYKALGELGPDLADAGKTDLGISGSSEKGEETLDLSIQISGNNFTPGVYSSDNSDYWVLVNYFTGFLTGNSEYYHIEQDPNSNTPSAYQITITSITATEIAGTFSGNYLYSNLSGNDKTVQITEGSFKVTRIR